MTPCPQCQGPHLYSLTYQHKVDCPIYTADSATANLDNINHKGIRPAMSHEKELINEQQHEHPAGTDQYGIRYQHRGVHDRAVVLLDADGHYLRDAARGAGDDPGDGAGDA